MPPSWLLVSCLKSIWSCQLVKNNRLLCNSNFSILSFYFPHKLPLTVVRSAAARKRWLQERERASDTLTENFIPGSSIETSPRNQPTGKNRPIFCTRGESNNDDDDDNDATTSEDDQMSATASTFPQDRWTKLTSLETSFWKGRRLAPSQKSECLLSPSNLGPGR